MAASYAYLTATSQVKVGAAKLKGLLVATGTDVTVAIYNTGNATTTGRIVANTMTFATTPAVMNFTGDEGGVNLDQGLYVVLGGTSPKVTLFYD